MAMILRSPKAYSFTLEIDEDGLLRTLYKVVDLYNYNK